MVETQKSMPSGKKKHKMLSCMLVLAMVVSMFAGMTVGANATTTSITTLAQLQAISMNGDYQLGADITINASNWTPLGTASAPFTGTFDGNGSNYTITWTGTGTGCNNYGIFGYSSGTIANVKAEGNLTLSGSYSYVSPIVGYSCGNVYNCTSAVTLTANNANNVGGIVGAMENSASTSFPIYIQKCGNTGSITASKRVGGVVGAVYCDVQGNCVVDQCYSKGTSLSNITIKTTNSGSKVWSGGLAGYVQGSISNCYSDYIKLQGSGGHYLSGLIGILNGSSPTASASNCYSNVISYTGCDSDYDRLFVGSVDNTSAVTLTNCYFTQNVSSYTQPTTTSGSWGTWIGGGLTSTLTGLTIGDKYTTPSGTNHAVLTCESNPYNYTFPGTTTYVYVDGTASTDGNGTESSPYNNMTSALSATNHSNIIILGKVTVSGTLALNEAINISGSSAMTSGTLFEVASGGTLTLSGGVNIDSCGVAVDVKSGGTLTVNNASLAGSTYSVKNAGTFNLDNASTATSSFDGTIYLDGTSITLKNAIPSAITVQLANPETGSVVATGSSYTISDIDEDMVSYAAGTYNIVLNTTANTLAVSVNPIYLDGTATEAGSGTYSAPYNTMDAALDAATESSDRPIYVKGTTALVSSGTWQGIYNGGSNKVTIVRDSSFSGIMFTVSSGSITLENLIIDGNHVTGTNLLRTYDGNVTLGNGVTFKNAVSSASGAALHVQGGTVTSSAAFTGNTAYNGGSVAVTKTSDTVYGTFIMSAGSIASSTATNNGGAVYLASGGVFTMNGGTISGNSATSNGSGVYVTAGATFNLGCSGIASGQVVYLANTSGHSDAYINLTAEPTSGLTVQCANPATGTNATKVAEAGSDYSSDFSYVNNVYDFQRVLDSTEGLYYVVLKVRSV